jgi:predicted CXXCH cytochrome family protein
MYGAAVSDDTTKMMSELKCSTCHRKLLKGKNVHPPVKESCLNCHESVGPHPLSKEGRKGWKFVQDPPALCEMCHAPFGKKPFVHAPVKEGKCTSCHKPHVSDEAKLLIKAGKDLCLPCHPDKMNFTYLHAPNAEGKCSSCHFPHESDHKSLLIKDGSNLCFSCHTEMKDVMKKKGLHPALLNGCTSCHNPHGAPHKKLLALEGDKLCFQCHAQIGEKAEKSKFVHAPLKSEKGCASCHSPHATDNAKLLVNNGKDLCLECHKNVLKKNMTVLHGPIRDGACYPCHEPHGSQNKKLLIKQFSTDPYVPYTDNEFALCFSCHNREMLRDPRTSAATEFRDGDKNLHYVHVNRKDKARFCGLCHEIHGGPQQKLIAESVTFGKWNLPLAFIKTDTGGSCTPGCHKTYNYDRKTPGKAPESLKPKKPEKKKKK